MEKENIICIDNNDLFTNGDPKEFKSVDVNVIGDIKNKNGKVISKINPLIMILNQNANNHKVNCQSKIDCLIAAGANPDQEIDYYGTLTTARQIAEKHRKHIKI